MRDSDAAGLGCSPDPQTAVVSYANSWFAHRPAEMAIQSEILNVRTGQFTTSERHSLWVGLLLDLLGIGAQGEEELTFSIWHERGYKTWHDWQTFR